MSSLLPSNATSFEKSLEKVMKSDMSSDIRYLWNPWKCPVELLWVLAVITQIDTWDEKWTEENKRKSIAEAFLVHAAKGTPDSIRRILRNAGYEEVEIIQGLKIKKRDGSRLRNGHFFYGWSEAWRHYRIYVERRISSAQAAQIKELIAATAPEHCVLQKLHYIEVLNLHDGKVTRNNSTIRGTV